MSQSSPEGIILGKGSKLISHKLVFSDNEAKPYGANPLILEEMGTINYVGDIPYLVIKIEDENVVGILT